MNTTPRIDIDLVDDYVKITLDKSTAVALEKALGVLNSFTAKSDNARMREFIMRLRAVIAMVKS